MSQPMRCTLVVAVVVGTILLPSFAGKAVAQNNATVTSLQLNSNAYGTNPRQFSGNAMLRQTIGRGLGLSTVTGQSQRTVSDLARNFITGGSGIVQNAAKPFANANTGGSSVTPYLGLSSPFTAPDTTYYTQIRPAMDQQRAMQQQMQQNAKFQSQLTQMAAHSPYDLQGSETLAPTGHVAVFQNTAGYYPQAQPQQRRR